MADTERRKAALKARMQEQVEVLKAMVSARRRVGGRLRVVGGPRPAAGSSFPPTAADHPAPSGSRALCVHLFQMAEKHAAKDKAREEDRAMAIAGREAVLALREERKEEFKKTTEKKASYSRTLAEQLREKEEIERRGAGATATVGALSSSRGGSASAENRAFILKTKSSDLDTEMAFRRQVQLLEKGPATRYNNSEALGPLVGFGAPTSVAIEEAGKAAAASEEAVVLETAKAHPLAVIRPKTTFIPAPGTGSTSLSLGALKATAGKR
jgi:hypothetical protein